MYALTRLVLGPSQIVEIDISQYNEIKYARMIIGKIFSIETNFHAICEAMKNLETHYFSETMHDLLYSRQTDQDFFQIGASYAPLLLASLATIRLYIDSIVTHAVNICSGDITNECIKSVFSKQYDQSFDYRSMEAIRNYAQHRSFPVHGVSLHGRWEGDKILFSTEYTFKVGSIKKKDNFKNAVLSEIRATGGSINLCNSFREYFFCLCAAHLEVRELMKRHTSSAQQIIKLARDRWRQVTEDDNMTGVAACKLDDGFIDKSVEAVYLKTTGDGSVDYLQAKLSSLVNINKRKIVI